MDNQSPVIIVHGGAGVISDEGLPSLIEGCKKSAVAGWEVLSSGGSALDAVEIAVMTLEDNPIYNAGTGSVLNQLGQVEMDAAIMDSSNLAAGAVAAVKGIKNPIKLARQVLEDGRHVLLAGDGALLFARQSGISECAQESLIVERQRNRWEMEHGTVGCVALDKTGKIVVGTSTGGVFNKLPGRVGDSPLLGCGTYADEFGGVSCTGNGEAIIRVAMAKSTLDFVRSGSHPMEAAKQAIAVLEKKTGDQAGLIIIDHQGRVGYAQNTDRMPICTVSGSNHIVARS